MTGPLESNETPESRLITSNEQVGGDHYKKFAISPIEFVQRNELNACEATVVKYVCRHRFKDGKKDIEKSIHLLQLLIEMEYPDE